VEGTVQALRRNNRARIIGLLREHGALHRAELARRSGLSRSTVSAIVSALIAEEVVQPANGPAAGHVGRGGELLSLNGRAGLVAGMDFSLGEVRVVVTGLSHEILGEAVRSLPAGDQWPDRLDAGVTLLEEVLRTVNGACADLIGVGLGIPDPIDLLRGTVGRARSGPTWTNARAAAALGERLNVPVYLDNTSHLAALAEVVWGAGVGARDVVYVKMSHGVGAGFLFNGQIYRGAIGAAGELGHVSVDENGPPCPCGNRGCLELYVGGTALLKLIRPVRGEDVGLQDMVGAAIAGDVVAERLIADAGATTGRSLASICNVLNPELVIVGGDLAETGELLLAPMRDSLSRLALKLIGDHVRVVPASLGNRAGAMGGVALVLRGGELGNSTQVVPATT